MKYWFWSFWTIDAAVSSVFLYFFLIGIADGTVSTFNLIGWLGILAVIAALLGGSFLLHARGSKGLKVLALCFVGAAAMASVLLLIGVVALIISNPRWN